MNRLNDVVDRGGPRLRLGIGVSIVCFIIYGSLVFLLPQYRNNSYPCERSSISAAVSNVILDAPLGVLDARLFGEYLTTIKPLRQVLKATMRSVTGIRAMPPVWINAIPDGNGIGYIVFATAAFRLFGVHVWALQLMMLVLMGCSAAAFLWRFGENFAVVVILYFTGLTVMLFSPLGWDPVMATQVPVAGIRYLALLAVLPGFHILLEIFDREAAERSLAWRNCALLAAQSAILALACLIRGNAVVLVGIVLLVWLVIGWRNRHERGRLKEMVRTIAIVGLAWIALVGAIAVSVPSDYLRDDRFGTVVWHRITEGIGTNPAFPFPGIDAMFNCRKYVPVGMQQGYPDSNGGCIYVDYLIRHHIPVHMDHLDPYGRQYETALREAFFRIVRHYPTEVLTTLVYYKPLLIIQSMIFDFRTNFTGDPAAATAFLNPQVNDTTIDSKYTYVTHSLTPYSKASIALLIMAVVLSSAYLFTRSVPPAVLRQIVGVTLLCASWTIPPYILVWAAPHTSADLFFFLIFLIGLGVAAIPVAVQALRNSARSAVA
jgi:hypothetical protein